MTQYVGILDGAGDVWGVRIPDLPGCHGAGATAEEACRDAIGALREYAAALLASGMDLPAPRTMPKVRADPRSDYNASLESFVMIPLLLDKARSVRANISIDAGVLEAVDEAAQEYGLTRSSFFASAAMDKIAASFAGKPSLHRSSRGAKHSGGRDKTHERGSRIGPDKDRGRDRPSASRNRAKKHR